MVEIREILQGKSILIIVRFSKLSPCGDKFSLQCALPSFNFQNIDMLFLFSARIRKLFL